MTEVKVIDLLMCLNGKLYSDCFKVLYGSSITFLTDFEFGTSCLRWASTGSGEQCCLVTALVTMPVMLWVISLSSLHQYVISMPHKKKQRVKNSKQPNWINSEIFCCY